MDIDRESFPETPAYSTALDAIEAGIEAAQPERVVRESVALEGDRLTVGDESHDLSAYESVLVMGGGNAAGHVATALEDVLGEALDGGIVVTDDPVETTSVDVLPADHPVPSEQGVESTAELLDRATAADADTLVLAVITGGGSSCMVAPAGEVTLEDVQATTDALLESGADIHEINAVRKHLSRIKGGQLSRALAPARVSTLVLSDVVGDDLDVIASGPLVPDSSTYVDALSVVEEYDLDIPEAVRTRLTEGSDGDREETPKEGHPAFETVTTHLVATNMTALRAARAVAAERGYETLVLSSRIRGEARQAALSHVAVAEEMEATGHPVTPPAVVISGGETTVTVTGEGSGGPNQEFALAAAMELPEDAVLAAVDTDGIDGNTDAAGAIVGSDAVLPHDEAKDALESNDVNPALAEHGALVETGRTGTNVNDLRVLVVE